MGEVTYEGGPQYELFLAVAVMIATISLRNLLVPLIFGDTDFQSSPLRIWTKFLMDFVIMMWPSLISVTVASEHMILLTFSLFALVATLVLLTFVLHWRSGASIAWVKVLRMEMNDDYGVTMNVTYFRGVMLILIAIAILAVDFGIFPSRFSKTNHYGHSIMDIGVAACVIGDGLGSRMSRALSGERRKPRPKTWKNFFLSSKFVLPLLGFLRTFILWLINYSTSVSEYGVHWNFFFTLGFVVIVTRNLPRDKPLIFCIAFATFTELLLRHGLENFVLFAENRRENIILANIEGISSLPGYISLYYASYAVADFVANTTMKQRTVSAWIICSLYLFGFSLIFYVAQVFCELVLSPPSRRVANVTYSLSQLSLLIWGFGAATAIQTFVIANWMAKTPRFSGGDQPFKIVEPCLMDTINYEGLWFFLLANVLTGLVNMTLSTHIVSHTYAFNVLTIYLLVSCSAAQLLRLWKRPKVADITVPVKIEI